METSLISTPQLFAGPVPLVCPACRGQLAPESNRIFCTRCAARFVVHEGIPDLIIGGRFDDPTDRAQLLYEEQSNEALARDYLIPLFRRLWPRRSPAPRILSLGCGTGMDVDLLCDAGFDCVGVDCGNRPAIWHRRAHPHNLILANGKHLPFDDRSFDGVFCGCVFPHVGVVGDSFQVTPNYEQERRALAREMTRVLTRQGRVLVSSPNRWFPFDLFHGRPDGRFTPRPYWSADPFLLSVGDYQRLFEQTGWSRATPMPTENYWGFVRSRNSLRGRVLGAPVRGVFWLTSREPLKFLRGSSLAPWIVVLLENPRQ